MCAINLPCCRAFPFNLRRAPSFRGKVLGPLFCARQCAPRGGGRFLGGSIDFFALVADSALRSFGLSVAGCGGRRGFFFFIRYAPNGTRFGGAFLRREGLLLFDLRATGLVVAPGAEFGTAETRLVIISTDG